jgi:WD domain, G-beta repeat
VVFSPDGKRLASASSTDRVVSLWDVATGKELHQYRWAGFIQGLAFLDGGRLLTARGPDVVWDVESGKVVRQNKDQRAIFPALTPDGRLQAALRMVADPGTEGKANRHVVITDPVTGKEVVSFPAQRPGREEDPNTYIMALAPAQDARAVLARYSGPEPYFALFNTATGQARRMQVRLNAERPSGRQNAATGLPFFLSDGRQVVYVEPPGKVHILEVASGLDRRTIEPRQGGVTALAASPDGRLLATGGSDGTAVVWNVSPAAGAARTAPTEAELEALWGDLLGDAPKAVNAIGVLGSAPEKAVPFLAGKVRPAPKPDLERIGRLIKDLDAGGMETRKAAEVELAQLGLTAKGPLEQALKAKPTLNAARRIEALLEKLQDTPLPAEVVRNLRAVEVLEAVGTPTARELIEKLAGGAEPDPMTAEAKATLARMKRPGD